MRLNILLIQQNNFNNLLEEDIKINFNNVIKINSVKEYPYLNLENKIDIIILDTSGFNIEHVKEIFNYTLDRNIDIPFLVIGTKTLSDLIPITKEINIYDYVETYRATSEIVNKLKIYSRSLDTHQTKYQGKTLSISTETLGKDSNSTRSYMNLPTFKKQTNTTTTFENPSERKLETNKNTKKKSKLQSLLKF